MEQVKVKMLFTTHTATHGTLKEGAILLTDVAFAKHLVEDCGAAKYDVAAKVAAAVVQPKIPAVPKPRAPKKGVAAEKPPETPPGDNGSGDGGSGDGGASS